MPSRRIQRLNEQLKREISQVIRREVRDPRVGLVTVTDVETTSDLAHARVFVRPLGEEQERSRALEGLRAAAPHIRHQLGQILRIRRVPELRFERDETLERAIRIEEILDDVRPEGGWDEETPEPAGDPVELAREDPGGEESPDADREREPGGNGRAARGPAGDADGEHGA